MKCPACNTLIAEAAARCPACGSSFGEDLQKRLAYYFSLRHEWEQLMMTSSTLNRQLKDLAGTILSLEQSIEADLAGSGQPEARQGEAQRSAVEAEPVRVSAAPRKIPGAPGVFAQKAPAGKTEDLTDRLKKQLFDPEFKIGQKALLFVGIVTMVFGVAFFLKYSFEQGWVGPAGRVALAYLWGMAFLLAGHVIKQRKFPAFGLSLFGGGIAVLYFATYAAFQIYQLLPQNLSFFVMVLITVLACATAIVYETQALAILGLIGGFMTPVLLSTGQDNYMVLFSYMTLLNLGILAISLKKRWVLLQYIGFAVTWILYSAWYADHYGHGGHKFWAALAFLNVFYLLYSIIPFAYHFMNREKHDLKGFYILIPNSIIAFSYNYFMIQGRYSAQWVSIITLAYAFLFMIFAYQIYRQGEDQREAFVVMLLKSSFFLILTVPLLFSKHWITVFWTLQAVTLLLGAKKLSKGSFFLVSCGLLALALFKFITYDMGHVFRYNLHPSMLYIRRSFGYLIMERWLTGTILIASLYQFVRVTGNKAMGGLPFLNDRGRSLAPVFAALFGGLLFIVVTLETSAYFHDYLGQARFAAISVVWTLFSMSIMVLGFSRNNDRMRKVALGLFFVTVLKVFFFDISRISTPYRILSFIVLGLILILVSYLYNKAKQRLLETQKDEGAKSDGT
ncbi:MAG TPA: DUF2339 domain-containing protein [Syntrophorhabdaceae bacterium]|nr:DUF2339 domain-containing protein [Syntrophorhabdaceae bacterium]